MSITLKDCLALPSMSFGTVIAGASGLDRIVSSVSVLEFFEHESYDLDVFTPNELVLSAFYDFKNDVKMQCEAIKDLSNTGSIALVLFYVGKILPYVDKKLIQTADEQGFPLIVLKNDSYRIKYSDIITSINGTAISTMEELSKAISKCKVGDNIQIGIIRNGNQPMTVMATLMDMNSKF